MSLFTRLTNVFRRDHVNDEIDEELRLHLEEAIEHGRDPDEARRAFGPLIRTRERSMDAKLATWLDSLRSDTLFGWRLLLKNKTASCAAVLSLALTIGACTAAFRLVDALLLRPLPVAAPERLYSLTYEYLDQNRKKDTSDSFDYPLFRALRNAAQDQAELLAISYASRNGLTYSSDDHTEKVYRQYVSGRTFSAFGLKPALGRLFTEADDARPGGHPYAVISYDYWTRRFGQDPKAVGRTYRMGNEVYEIVGVAPAGFTGTETGTLTDLFVPTMMNAKAIENANWGWFRTWIQLKPGANPEAVRQRLAAAFSQTRREKAKAWKQTSPARVNDYVNAPLRIEPAMAGVSVLQKKYRQSLLILGALVAMLLLIACANVANLMLAQAAARACEMALRVSIGAGRWRLVQMVLAESAMIAVLATLVGACFAWWAAPYVVSLINPPDEPARLSLPADLRVLGFAVVLTAVVVFLFGLAPAVRASSVKPMFALRGGDEAHTRRRWMNTLVAAQVAFCFLVHFVAGLFVTTFDRLSSQPTGFSAERLLILEINTKADRPASAWDDVARHLRTVPGVEKTALCGWPLLGGNAWTEGVRVTGRDWDASPPYFLAIAPTWLDTMSIPLLAGRDFRPDDIAPHVAIVNEAFAKHYFDGQNPVGRRFEQSVKDKGIAVEVVGWVRDAKYRDMREAVRPTAYVPWQSMDGTRGPQLVNWSSYVVRTASSDPLAVAATLRKEVTRAQSDFRVVSMNTQEELVRSHTVRERLLAMLSMFFAVVALLLAGVGLYGVLNYSVLQRRREIGIRMALGARSGDLARRVTAEVFGMLVLGSVIGLAAGVASERYVQALLFGVKSTDLTMLAIPAGTILVAGLVAALPPVIQAVRVDPAQVLRAE